MQFRACRQKTRGWLTASNSERLLLPPSSVRRRDRPPRAIGEPSVSVVGAGFELMLFLRQACAAIVLVMLTLAMQSAGMAGLIEWAKSHFARGAQALGPWGSAVLVVRFTSLIVCLHILEILLGAAFYRWCCLRTWESAFYFSAASYSTVGYGDVVLQPVWRLLGPVESVSGALMCGLSASFLFAVVTRLIESRESAKSHR